jgi:hypothetical protein
MAFLQCGHATENFGVDSEPAGPNRSSDVRRFGALNFKTVFGTGVSLAVAWPNIDFKMSGQI